MVVFYKKASKHVDIINLAIAYHGILNEHILRSLCINRKLLGILLLKTN